MSLRQTRSQGFPIWETLLRARARLVCRMWNWLRTCWSPPSRAPSTFRSATVMGSASTYLVPVPVPFYSQRIPTGQGAEFGFGSEAEAEYWTARGCGIACLRMVIDGFRRIRRLKPMARQGELIRQGLDIGAYCEKGWIHSGLVRLARNAGLDGRCFRNAGVDDIVRELVLGRPCIASVTAGFDGGEPDWQGHPTRRGGHLVVVIGIVNEESKVSAFIVNHPSSDSKYEWEQRAVDLNLFCRSFAGLFMSFWEPQNCAD